MLAELTIIPVGGDSHTSGDLADVLKFIDDSGLPYQLTPSATCIEGDWNEVMALVRLCHQRVLAHSPHVVTTIKIEEDLSAYNQLTSNVSHVEAKAGRALRRMSSVAAPRI
jgi:uncharacterized protein (TIGR00106 family)